MSTLITWLDATPWHFWTIALGTTVVWLFTVVRSNTPFWAWTLTSFALLLAWRWPYLVGPAILNPDEAHIIAGAITLRAFPVYWKFVDGTTHGPLANIFLLVTHAVGVPLNYGGARLVGGLLMIGGFLLSARGLRLVFPERAVRAGLALPIFLWSSIAYYDFAGYTSEQPVLFLLLAASWPLLSALIQTNRPREQSWRLLAGGILLGLIPFAKLQGVPPGLALGVGTAAVICRQSHPRWDRFVLLASLVGGALLPSLVVAVYMLAWGLGAQFWAAYIQNNLLYAQASPFAWRDVILDFWNMMYQAPGLQTVVITLAALALVLVGRKVRGRPLPWIVHPRPAWTRLRRMITYPSARTRRVLAALAIVTLACCYATLAPRRPFGHYLQFLAPPIALAAVILCASFWSALVRLGNRQRAAMWSILVVLLISPLVVARFRRADPEMLGTWTRHAGEWRKPVSKEIAALASPGDTLSVWGWMPYFYVETGLPHATREAHTSRQIDAGPMREFYRTRYLQDFQRRPPRIFVDAVGGENFGYGENQPYSRESTHESFPALREIIVRDYTLVKEADGCRIYLRKQRS